MVIAQQTGQQPFVYALFGQPDNKLFGWSMTTSGALAPLTNLPAPLLLDLDASIPFNQYSMTTNPAGTLLFIADSFGYEIFVFQISNTGALSVVTGSPFPTPVGINPGNLTTDGLGKYLYATETSLNHTGAKVLGYSIGDGTNGTTLGALTQLSSSPFAFPMWQVQGDASGLFLVGTTGNSKAPGFSNVDDPHLYVFSIQQTATATPARYAYAGSELAFATTNSPLNIAVQPASSGGEFVYSFGINDTDTAYNPIEGYQLGATGTLTAISGFPHSRNRDRPLGPVRSIGDKLVRLQQHFKWDVHRDAVRGAHHRLQRHSHAADFAGDLDHARLLGGDGSAVAGSGPVRHGISVASLFTPLLTA